MKGFIEGFRPSASFSSIDQNEEELKRPFKIGCGFVLRLRQQQPEIFDAAAIVVAHYPWD